MDIWDYFERVKRVCDDRSLRWDDLQFAAAEGSNELRGIIVGYLVFDLDDVVEARLRVDETIQIDDTGNPNIIEYAYVLVVDGVEFWGEEIDLSHDPPVHRHTRGHAERLEADPVTLPDIIEKAWREISDYIAQGEAGT